MQTIVEPKQYIDRLWGKQKVRKDETYRQMKYVLRVDHEGKVLLHNVVTGQLVVLDHEEAEVVDKLPQSYSSVMEQLLTEHYLVPEGYDEHQQVVNLRNILSKLEDACTSTEGITYFTILPTTACNARCWYCFEQGMKTMTMTEETADQVVEFIERNCKGNPIKIRWFGGEPTVAAKRIDQISKGLKSKGVVFSSIVTSNGYLFDEDMVATAKQVWNTTQVTISIDGTEESYNRVKAFPGVTDNPYQRMMRNVGLLLDRGINVAIRMNFDRITCDEFQYLLHETNSRFRHHPRLMVYPHQINEEIPYEEWCERSEWLNRKNEELGQLARKEGNFRRRERVLPNLFFMKCEAGSTNSVTIRPDGKIVSCPEQLSDEQVKGSVTEGITNYDLCRSWNEFADYPSCQFCELFPECARLANCASESRCSNKLSRFKQARETILSHYSELETTSLGGRTLC